MQVIAYLFKRFEIHHMKLAPIILQLCHGDANITGM